VGAVAERWFLKVDGITGDSAADGHAGEIDVLAWSWGVSHPGDGPAGGSGGGTGKPDFQDFHFVARISKASPRIALSCATGAHHKFAALSGAAGEKVKGAEFLKYKLTDIQVTSLQQADGEGGAPPTEQFTMSYAKFEVSYRPQKMDGSLDVPVTAAYDLMSGKKI
jgi:type VI secretion system secreted protein Hcp